MGIEEGPELTAFLRDERAKAREERQAEQEKDNRAREAANRATELQQQQQQEAANRARDQEHALRLAEIQRDTARGTADRHDATQIREASWRIEEQP